MTTTKEGTVTTTTDQPRPPSPASPRGPAPGGAAVLAVGVVLTLAGLVVAGLASASAWGLYAQRDGRFVSAPTARYAVDSYALTTTDLHVVLDRGPQPAVGSPARVAVEAAGADPSQPVFVGLGRSTDVAAYLSDVRHSVLTQVRFDPFVARYREVAGARSPGLPGKQPFWLASASGRGSQRVEADLRSGDWVVVVMNADAGPGVAADLTVGARTRLLVPATIGLGSGTLLLLGAGVLLLVLGAAGLAPAAAAGSAATQRAPGTAAEQRTPYPVRLTGQLDPGLSRWLWLVKWVLAVPHYLVLAALWTAFVVTTLVAGVAILVTGRYPRALFDFNVGVLRWNWRVGFYAYSALGTDRYPPFSLAPSASYPADLEVDRPERLSRGPVLVKSWLLAVPHLLVVALLTTPLAWTSQGASTQDVQRDVGVSLLGLLVLVAGLSLLFAGRYPRPLFDLVVGIDRWVYRVAAYVGLMRDEYPPFRLDQGPDEPSDAGAAERLATPGA